MARLDSRCVARVHKPAGSSDPVAHGNPQPHGERHRDSWLKRGRCCCCCCTGGLHHPGWKRCAPRSEPVRRGDLRPSVRSEPRSSPYFRLKRGGKPARAQRSVWQLPPSNRGGCFWPRRTRVAQPCARSSHWSSAPLLAGRRGRRSAAFHLCGAAVSSGASSSSRFPHPRPKGRGECLRGRKEDVPQKCMMVPGKK